MAEPPDDPSNESQAIVDASETGDPAPESGPRGQGTGVDLEEAGSRLRDLVDQARRCADVVLSDGELEVRLVLLPPTRRVLGQDAGLFEVPDDFDEPLPDVVIPSIVC